MCSPPCETFDIAFEPDLRRGLAAVGRIGRRDRPGLRALREQVLPRREEFIGQLERLHHLQHAVHRLRAPFVLCHTDMGGDNLLVDGRGQLWVLDWDGVTMAPPEHDLHGARWTDLWRVHEFYWETGGAHSLHLDHFAFYLLRRHLGDMAVRLLRILEEDTSEEQDEDLLYGIEAWGFAQWSAPEEALDRIAAALQYHNR